MKVIAGYYVPIWHKTEVEIDDKFSIFETDDWATLSKIIDENPELHNEMIAEVNDRLDDIHLNGNEDEPPCTLFAVDDWSWNIIDGKNKYTVLAEN